MSVEHRRAASRVTLFRTRRRGVAFLSGVFSAVHQLNSGRQTAAPRQATKAAWAFGMGLALFCASISVFTDPVRR
jgi:hypothetical protein